MVKALLAVTSYNGPFYPNGDKTGLYATEAIEPFLELAQKGYEVTIASETGEFGYDPHSLTEDALQGKAREVYENKDSSYNTALKNIKKASDLTNEKFDLFFASAGHATLFDYPKAKNLQKILIDTYLNGGVVAAVCHGPAIFENLEDPKTKQPFVKGKKITGFTDEGEEQLGLTKTIKDHGLLTIKQVAEKEGATYVPPKGPWDAFSVTDGKIVTGVNPQSAFATVRDAVVAVESVSN
ncbi:HSP31 [Candida theae]|uniref:D-lactate dehydratase n=1 Tax=Candida theae TaxID=1198502 RepID=A0AAD5BAG8_9ASCO|nr:HSP31 [Candida theae]KAI5949222.1 HSP31 [Candida theae]